MDTLERVSEAEIIPFSEVETSQDKENCAHIVKVRGNESALAKVLDARINGVLLEALCGFKWIPSKNPENLPVCEACKEIYEAYKSFNEGLNDRPSA